MNGLATAFAIAALVAGLMTAWLVVVLIRAMHTLDQEGRAAALALVACFLAIGIASGTGLFFL